MDFVRQYAAPVRFEWGLQGVLGVANHSAATVIVDVLSFSTCVDIACARGASVFPYSFKDNTALAFAEAKGALLAGSRGGGGFSLSPQSLLGVVPGTRLVLPSPNGSALSLSATSPLVLAGCLRNAVAVARHLEAAQSVTLVAAGERWPDGSLRPALEDILGAGAIIHSLKGRKSPEAQWAEASYLALWGQLEAVLENCASGVELIEKGYPQDVALAAQLESSQCVPQLVDGAYRAA